MKGLKSIIDQSTSAALQKWVLANDPKAMFRRNKRS